MGMWTSTAKASRTLGLGLFFAACATTRGGRLVVVANDEKVTWDEAGQAVLHPPGNDTIAVFDVSRPDVPALVTVLPLANSVIGPPTNVHVIDLGARPPRVVGTVDVGEQPSGVDINPRGDLARE